MFQVVNERYLHHRPMLFTTNKPLAAWGLVLHDPDLAEAILDRVLERGRHIELRGRSYRTRHAPLDLNPAPEPPSPAPARISGNHRPEFPEPTALARPKHGQGLADCPIHRHPAGAMTGQPNPKLAICRRLFSGTVRHGRCSPGFTEDER